MPVIIKNDAVFIFILLLIPLIPLAVNMRLYGRTQYFKNTRKSYFEIRRDRGSYGEFLVYKRLRGYEKAGARFLFNLYIPYGNNKTSEIDVLMITNKGIVVIESKNFSGCIYGSEDDRQWVQVLPNGRQNANNYFNNPILQNRTHIKYLQAHIGNVPIWSVIAFSERCTLKSIRYHDSSVFVVKRQVIEKAVSALLSFAKDDAINVQALYEILLPYSNVDREQKIKHIMDIRSMPLTDPAAAYSEPYSTCPRCGGRLVERTATRGASAGRRFWGCSNFPYCRYTRSIDE